MHAYVHKSYVRSRVRSVSTARSSATGMAATVRRVVRGIVFDMDGTLTVPVLDFALMRHRLGITAGDILDVLTSRSPEEQRKGFSIIAEMEEEALQNLSLMPGVLELCQHLDDQGIPRGLITRNVKRGVDYFHANAFNLPAFFPAISRESAFPYKPSPDALLHICSTWGIHAHECIMIGDSAKDDIVCGTRAGAYTILLDEKEQYGAGGMELLGEMQPTFKVKEFSEVQQLLQREFTLLPPGAPAHAS